MQRWDVRLDLSYFDNKSSWVQQLEGLVYKKKLVKKGEYKNQNHNIFLSNTLYFNIKCYVAIECYYFKETVEYLRNALKVLIFKARLK